ncbi:hypothetical protein AAV35_006425 [Salimicrobium jeotgali]|uniref:Dynamin N-terminal domain-containing protein n=1 Tax=Salimicrobium jeotgali TaxID=1230341 RepID=K2FP88_9BACI|nr:dynamin family protein [Salimicrobium jeotgali]AKG04456.1 hypothetical protein AAV35_006425 [Salimicrobium jeotgali]EKE32661.1 hypothetical protein MJ3_01847 [Salimicrobium jeotgali]MBM7695353.1 small GTP-binding protein [Salimicrobium jeotgali]
MTTVQTSAHTIKQLYTFLVEEGLTEQAEKVLDIYEKDIEQTFVIGFAGHFSAGKSSLINYLAGTDVLPSSPIPTSANIVRLQKGEEMAVAYNQEKRPIAKEASRDLDRLQALCKDNRQIASLSIYKSDVHFPENIMFIDTPGVDSTDDMDRTITEGSLHIVDHLYYVVDYNHVQSEVNSSFLTELENQGISYTLVINQMDKHQEEEVTFDDFSSSVREWLTGYELHPQHIFYTSMHQEHLNRLEGNTLLNEDVQERISERNGKNHIQSVLKECDQALRHKYDIDAYEAELEAYSTSSLEEAGERIEAIKHNFMEKKNSLEEQYKKRVRGFLKNAYITPAVLRDDAQQYLESTQPNFKKGLIFTKDKTEEERKRRRDVFYENLSATLEKNLEWPLRDRMRELADTHSLTDEHLEKRIQQFHVQVPEQLLEDVIATGANVTGEYVLRYMDELSKDILKLYQQETEDIYKQMKEQLDAQQENELALLGDEEEELNEKQRVEEQLNGQKEKWEEKRKLLYRVHDGEIEQDEQQAEAALAARKETDFENDLELEYDQRLQKEEQPEESGGGPSGSKTEIRRKAEEVLPVLQDYEFLESYARSIKEKLSRVDHQQFTVALFGAFSAGKSSFINALLGGDYLPTSPNPTTASINRVVPPEDNHPNETATVHFLTEKELIESFDFLDVSGPEEILRTNTDELETRKRTMVQAFQNGYEELKGHIGSRLEVSQKEFVTYVRDESHSVFVKAIDFYVDSVYAREGITFVDTPGADSVNDRHTDVSFGYIKEADAILFLTYYNHAFTKADAGFLRQLGRVKDSFAVDKMFFIINASDLAQSEEDLQSVRSYIESQLTFYGIRNPRMHAVSSLKARQGEKEESNLPAFERDFRTFIHEDLQAMVFQSVHSDLEETVEVTSQLLDFAAGNEEEQKRQLDKWGEEERRISEILLEEKGKKEAPAVGQKVDKQFHYLEERQILQVSDFFKEEINPGYIQGEKSEIKPQLVRALDRLLNRYEKELLDEVRAISLRMESFVGDLLRERSRKTVEQVKAVTDSRPFKEEKEEVSVETPSFTVEIEETAEDLDISLQRYSSAKQLFEGNRKEELREEVKEQLPGIFGKVLTPVEESFAEYYKEAYLDAVSELMDRYEEKVKEYYRKLRNNGEDAVSTEELQELKEKLTSSI